MYATTQLRQRRRPALKNFKEGSVPTWPTDRTLLLQWHRCSEARDLQWIKNGCCFKAFHRLLLRTHRRFCLLYSSTQLDQDGLMSQLRR